MPEMWEDIRVNVIRSQPVDQNGPCANHRPADDDKTTVLEPGIHSFLIYIKQYMPKQCVACNCKCM